METETSRQYYDDNTISIYEILLILKKRWLLIFLVASVFTGSFVTYSVISPKVYKVSNVLIFSFPSSGNSGLASIDSGNSGLASIDIVWIESALKLLNELSSRQQAEELELDKSILDDIKNIKISGLEKSNALKIEVDTLSRESGIKVLQAITNFANSLSFVQKKIIAEQKFLKKNQNDLTAIINNPFGFLNLPENTVISEALYSLYPIKKELNRITNSIDELKTEKVMKLAGKTSAPEMPFKPRRFRLAGLGVFIGVFAGIFFAFFMEWIANAPVKNETES
jgi:uncharacterized protein involved in exopolysaccharide biosynthesis